MSLHDSIKEQWTKPEGWVVDHTNDAVEISDDEGDFVVSCMTYSQLTKSIKEHLVKSQTEAAFDLLLSGEQKNET